MTKTEDIIIRQPEIREEGGWRRVSVPIQHDGRTSRVQFWVSDGPISTDGNSFLALTLVPAMRRGCDLRVEAEASRRLLTSLPTLQDILCEWYPDLTAVRVSASGEQPIEKRPTAGVACFFSGGVDSFYSVLKHRHEITKLIYLQGFDIGLEHTAMRTQVDPHVRQAASELGIPLIEVKTDFHTSFSNHFAGESWARWWGEYYHGSVLACVALLLGRQFERVYIPSSHTYAELMPWGSHPLTDPLWSTETTEIVHDGCEATRVEKVRAIAASDTVLRHLHVCGGNKEAAFNCGKCEKCLRTMVNLYLAGALDRCEVLPKALDESLLAMISIPNASTRAFIEENLGALERDQAADEGITRALRACLDREAAAGNTDIRKLQQRLADQNRELASLRATVRGYESGKVMRLMLLMGNARQKLAGSKPQAMAVFD